MIKACIEKINSGETNWVSIPDRNLSSVISNFINDNDWECIIITGLKKDYTTSFVNNSFHKCDIYEFNNLIIELEEYYHFDSEDIKNLAVLNLFLEDRNQNCEEVLNTMCNEQYRIYNAKSMEEVAIKYLEDCGGTWFDELKRANLEDYFDFKSYGEEVLGSSGNWLQDEYNEIIIEVFD